MKRILLATTSLLVLNACGDDGPPPPPSRAKFPIEVAAKDIDGQPLAKVGVTVDGKVVGYTGADGKFAATLAERPGAQVTVGVKELDGYRWNAEPVTETLKLNSSERPVPVSYAVIGESRKKDYMVWVKVTCDPSMPAEFCVGRPVKLAGQEVAKTDDFGYAHFLINDVPGTVNKILIDTPTVNPLTDSVMAVPEDPTFEVTLDLEPQVFVIEETFVNALAKNRQVRQASPSRTAKKPAAAKPVAKTPDKKPATKPAQKPKDDVIDLF